MSKLKNGCVTELSSDMHKKYDVTNLPYQNLNPTHPVRMAWESKEVEDATKEQREPRNSVTAKMRYQCVQVIK